MITVNEAFSDWETDGIFSYLVGPWDNSLKDALNLIYHGNHSGDKYVSSLIDKLAEDNILSTTNREKIANAIVAIYGVSWSKEYATLSVVYNPIENYSLTEQMTNDETVITYGHTQTRTDNLRADSKSGIYGFNDGVNPSPANTDEIVNTGTQTNADTGSDRHKRDYTLTRSGNIGVTTSQQMLQSERALWLWNYFNDVVFPDVDKIITLPIY